MTYLGREFKCYEELTNWNKDGHIKEYRKLAKMFGKTPTMEISSIMSERAVVLHDRFGMSWKDIEELEIA
ncbi:hypothetical protein D7X98_04300 [bacterium 1XD8-76]|nr:hypothetical protein D7X98_04300 [bacterium 1XD8-76]